MRKIFAVIPLIIVCLVFLTACSNSNPVQNKGGLMDKKILVAYFSWSGNTEYIAKQIQAKTGADLFKIDVETPYPKDYSTVTQIAKKQIQGGEKVAIKGSVDTSAYDLIIVGTPAWWYTMAPAVKTFLEDNNFEGKEIATFVTHGGGGGYKIAQEMNQYAKGSKLVAKPLVIYSRGDSNTDKEIDNLVKSLK